MGTTEVKRLSIGQFSVGKKASRQIGKFLPYIGESGHFMNSSCAMPLPLGLDLNGRDEQRQLKNEHPPRPILAVKDNVLLELLQ